MCKKERPNPPEVGGGARPRGHRTGERGHPPNQPRHQRSEGELHTTTLATAEGPDGRVDDDEVKRRRRHDDASVIGSGSQNRRR